MFEEYDWSVAINVQHAGEWEVKDACGCKPEIHLTISRSPDKDSRRLFLLYNRYERFVNLSGVI